MNFARLAVATLEDVSDEEAVAALDQGDGRRNRLVALLSWTARLIDTRAPYEVITGTMRALVAAVHRDARP